MNPEDSQLSTLVRTLEDSPALPADFQSRVWHTIEARQRTSSHSMAVQLTQAFATLLSRPRLAWATALVAIVIGAGSGQWQAAVVKRHFGEELQESYVASVDPYVALGVQKHP